MGHNIQNFEVTRPDQTVLLTGKYDKYNDLVYLAVSGALIKQMAGQALHIKNVTGPASLGNPTDTRMQLLGDNADDIPADGPNSIKLTIDFGECKP